jgi:hypothetical protein
MPRWKQRLPNASGGGPPPEFDIDVLRRQIETRYLAPVDLTDKSPEFLVEFCAQLVEATRQYLWRASLIADAQPIDVRTKLLNRALIAATEYKAALDAINAGGDAGDHINALYDRHFWHHLIPQDSDEGTLAILAGIAGASERAFAQTRDVFTSDVDAGHKVNLDWEIWIRRLIEICDSRGLPTSARKDDDKRSDDTHSTFVLLVHELQQGFERRYRRGEQSLSALANAIYRARVGSGTKIQPDKKDPPAP